MAYKPADIDKLGEEFKTFLPDDKPTILVIDDSGTNRKMMIRILKELNYIDISEAKGGMDGFLKLNSMQSENILVLLDLNMPQLDGVGFLRKVRADKDLGDTPIIVVSTETKKERIIEVVQAGAQGYVVKPFTKDQIRDKILAVMAKR